MLFSLPGLKVKWGQNHDEAILNHTLCQDFTSHNNIGHSHALLSWFADKMIFPRFEDGTFLNEEACTRMFYTQDQDIDLECSRDYLALKWSCWHLNCIHPHHMSNPWKMRPSIQVCQSNLGPWHWGKCHHNWTPYPQTLSKWVASCTCNAEDDYDIKIGLNNHINQRALT